MQSQDFIPTEKEIYVCMISALFILSIDAHAHLLKVVGDIKLDFSRIHSTVLEHIDRTNQYLPLVRKYPVVSGTCYIHLFIIIPADGQPL